MKAFLPEWVPGLVTPSADGDDYWLVTITPNLLTASGQDQYTKLKPAGLDDILPLAGFHCRDVNGATPMPVSDVTVNAMGLLVIAVPKTVDMTTLRFVIPRTGTACYRSVEGAKCAGGSFTVYVDTHA